MYSVKVRIAKLDEAIEKNKKAIAQASNEELKQALESLLRNLKRRKKQLKS